MVFNQIVFRQFRGEEFFLLIGRLRVNDRGSLHGRVKVVHLTIPRISKAYQIEALRQHKRSSLMNSQIEKLRRGGD
jgi:hypothetical protein